ncbi:MAG: molybdopterin dinucleotide binding domain-containing protein, partial [Mycobacterium sp.]
WTMGLNQSTHGTWNTNAICNLHLATGAICRPGSGPMSLTGQPNAMGGREMGYMGPGLPGQRSVTSAADRDFVEQQWGLPAGTIRDDVGPGTVAMFDRLAEGTIKACWIICTNPVASGANRKTVVAGLEAADLVITQDAYQSTATNRYADIVLPAALWAEADGVMVNSERTITLLQASIPPAGQARPDWQLICQVATHLGFGEHFDFSSSEEVFDEIRRFSNPASGYDLRGVSYPRLRRTPLQWPCPPDDHDRHPIRYLNDGISQDMFVDADGRRPRLAFPTPSRRAVFHARPHMDSRELPDDEFPLVLNTGRLPHQWHTMTKTGRVAKLNKLNGTPFVELHPRDAEVVGIVDGQAAELMSRRGRAVLPAVVTDRVRRGSCFVPFHWNDEHGEGLTINALTNDAVDADSLQPEFKVCAVSARPVGPAPTRVAQATAVGACRGPLVLWASQTGNAEDFAVRLARRLGDTRLANMDDVALSQLSAARDVLIVTSTFGDGGPPDNGAAFWDRLGAPDAPTLSGVRYAVLGIGDRAYADFCGYAKSIDGRFADLGATKLVDRAECEAYDNGPMSKWADEVAAVLGVAGAPNSTADEPFTRADPVLAKLCRNTVLTGPSSAKEVRQVGFDISEYDVGYAVGDSLGVCATNSGAVVAAWLAATGLDEHDVVEVDGERLTLRDALTRSYDICRVTPDLLRFVAENCADRAAAKVLREPSHRLNAWLAGRNGLDIVEEFTVRAAPAQWQDVLVRLTP